MKTKNFLSVAIITVMMALAAGMGCKKENPGAGYMNVQMSEARIASGSTSDASPNPVFSAVNLDIKSVEVHYANETQENSGWVSLNTNAGIYDVLMLQNDITATLAGDTKLPLGTITQMRLVLGPENSVLVSGDSQHMLTVPSGEESGIKINLNTTILSGKHTTIALDFDANASIVVQGNSEYKFKPVIRVKSVTTTY